MFKLALLFVVGAAAVDTAPVISLDLQEVKKCDHSSDVLPCNNRTGVRNATVPPAAHFADECEVNTICNLPTPKAYDHHEGDISEKIEKTYNTFVTSAKCTSAIDVCTPVEAVADAAANFNFSDSAGTNFNETRGMYVIYYDVKDVSENAAEQVKFAVIMRDTTAPTTTFTNTTQVLERGNSGLINPNNSYTDNFDTYVKQPENPFPADSCAVAGNATKTVNDFASIFGKDNANNVITTTFIWTVDDTTPPEINDLRAINVNAAFNETSPVTVLNTTGDETYIECESTEHNYTVGPTDNSHATDSVYEFTDAGDACASSTPKLTLTSVHTDNTDFTSEHASTIVLTVIASDEYDNTATPKTHSFKITDTTPPEAVHEDTHMITAGRNKGSPGAFEVNAALDNTLTGGGNKHTVGADNVTNLGYFDGSIVQHSAGYVKDWAQIKELKGSFSCTDDCGTTSATSAWHNVDAATACDTLASEDNHDTFNFEKSGTYILKYTCTDAAGLTDSKCMTVYNVDHTRPVLNLVAGSTETASCDNWRSNTGNDDGTCEESHPSRNYVDSGARCSDVVDGVISELVEVSGQVVDLKQPGTYVIDYACSDTGGNSAIAMTREVYVIDATCPTCFLIGCGSGSDWDTNCTETQEASFPYSDPGAECQDRNGQNITATVTGVVDVENTGTYKITYTASDDANGLNTATLADTNTTCNAFVEKTGAAHVAGNGYNDATKPAQVRTVVVADSMRPVIFLQNNMMEETSSVNGWVIAAAGSAVAGIALLSFSSRKNVATHVPV